MNKDKIDWNCPTCNENYYHKSMNKELKELYAVLAGAEELIEELDPNEKNKNLMKVYRFIHAFNKKHPCYDAHSSWREEFMKFIKI